MGRKRLEKLCGGDGMPLLGRHSGRVPERLVAIVGGPGSGKTSYLLMAVHRIIEGGESVRGTVDDPAQEREFLSEWAKLEAGTTPSKTGSEREFDNARLLHVFGGQADFGTLLSCETQSGQNCWAGRGTGCGGRKSTSRARD
jgi:hypothetical protein